MLDSAVQSDAAQLETGFGTGLRAHIEHRLDTTVEEDGALAPAAEEAPHAEPQPERDPAAVQLAERERSIAEAEAALRRRAHELADQQAALEAEAARLAAREAELAAEAADGRAAREVLRELAERDTARLWTVFEQALDATERDGRPDHGVRILAARALLAEAYGEERAPVAPPATLEDELARLRDRRAGAQHSSM